MYRLYYGPGTAAMAPHAVLEEIGARFELVKLDLAAGEHRKRPYLDINPKGRVPALVEGDDVLTESAAIVMHLCDRHPEAKLAPAPGTRERAHFYEWMLYLSNTVQPATLEYFYPDRFTTDPAQAPGVKASAERRVGEMMALIDGHLGKGGPYLLGAIFSAADIFLHMLVRWTRWFEKPGYRYPSIKRCTDLVKARPAVVRMMAAQGIAEQEKAP